MREKTRPLLNDNTGLISAKLHGRILLVTSAMWYTSWLDKLK